VPVAPQPSLTSTRISQTQTPSPPATSSPTLTAAPTFTASPTAAPTSTPDPYAGLTIAHLASRTYGGGELTVEDTLAVTGAFTRTVIRFPSDGLNIYGFMNVPQGEGPFPVALVLHGYIDPAQYDTLAYTTRYANVLAQAGYLTLHPNLRNYPPSDDGPNPYRVGFAVDVLNLVGLIRAQAGQPGPLQSADAGFIGLFGHSMGGGISLRVSVVSPDVDAVVLYGSMSGDEKRNFERILLWSNGTRGQEELNTQDEDLARISAGFFLDRIGAAVSIHHGEADQVVPPAWSVELCEQLRALGKPVECFTYPGQAHTFAGEGDQLLIRRVIDFFNLQAGR